jgi:protein-S-isoprenylcysteine O-methyltransferase Ste14
MPATVLALSLLYYGLVFGLRNHIHRRRTGASGVHWLKRGARPIEWITGAVLLAPTLLGPVAPLAELAGWVQPYWTVDRGLAVTGLAASALFALATFFCQLAMGDAWRIGVDSSETTSLVTSGVFRIVRNPIYSCLIATCISLGSLVPNPITAGLLVLLLVGIQLQVRAVEEPHLIRTHGDAFVRYAAGSGRFVPWVGRVRA